MWIDHHALFKPITKASLRLRARASRARSPKRCASRPPSRKARCISICPKTWRSRLRRIARARPEQRTSCRRPTGPPTCARARTCLVGEAADRCDRRDCDADAPTPDCCDSSSSATLPVRLHDDGQRADRRRASAFARLHRARVAAGCSAASSAARGSGHRPRVRHDRGRG